MKQILFPENTFLNGSIDVVGNETIALACLAASLYSDDPVVLQNVPRRDSVSEMLLILKSLGSDYSFIHNTVIIRTKDLHGNSIPLEIKNLSLVPLLLGPLLSLTGEVTVPDTGLDLQLFSLFGAVIFKENDTYRIIAKSLRGYAGEVSHIDHFLSYILVSMGIKSPSHFELAVVSSEADSLLRCITKMGCFVNREKQGIVTVKSGVQIHGADHSIEQDIFDAQMVCSLLAVYDCDVIVKNMDWTLVSDTLVALEDGGKQYSIEPKGVRIKGTALASWNGPSWRSLFYTLYSRDNEGFDFISSRLSSLGAQIQVVEEK